MDPEVEGLLEGLRAYQFNFISEHDLQDGVEEVLQSLSLPYEREKALTVPTNLGNPKVRFESGTVGSREKSIQDVFRCI